MCQKGAFRGTVFFVAEGHGKVVLDAPEEIVRFGLGAGGNGGGCGGSSTESLLAAAAFGDRRRGVPKAKRSRRRRGDERRRETSDERLGDGHEEVEAMVEPGQAAGTEPPSVTEPECGETEVAAEDWTGTAVAESPPTAGSGLQDSHEKVKEQPSQEASPSVATAVRGGMSSSFADGERGNQGSDDVGGGELECCSKLAVLKRGAFFGIDPASPTAAASSGSVS